MHHSIKKNSAQCLNCGDILESKHVHDYVVCSCGSIAVDGGHDYIRRVGSPSDYKELSEENAED